MRKEHFRLLGLMFVLCLIVALTAIAATASPPQPTYGTAVVDGNISEWNLTTDFFANMYRAGKPDKPLESRLYLRYDCSSHTLYVLVLTVPGVSALAQGYETAAWGAIGTVSNKVYTGNSGNPPSPPQFAWVGLSGDHLTAQGYEASFTISPGTPASPALYSLIVHVEVSDSGAQTSATAGFPTTGIPLELICSAASINVAKTYAWTTGDGSHVGDVVTFTFTVTNTGQETLSPVTVVDDKLGPITLGATSLAPGASTTGTATLTLTQALLDIGSQTNTATATGTTPTGGTVTDQDTKTVTFLTAPAIEFIKDYAWTTGDGSEVGDVVTFYYTVTNTGNVTLNPVTVVDDKFGLITLSATSLAPGATATGTATLTLTQALLDLGSHTNTAVATATPPSGPPITRTRTRTVTFITTPAIQFVKDYAWTTGDGSHVGDVVTYTYTVTNTGNVTLNPVTVVDDKMGPITLSATSLAPGATATGTAALTLTQALLDAGFQTNVATATATPPSGPDVVRTRTKTVTFLTSPAIEFVKEFAWTTGDGSHIGDVVTYTYIVTNTGNVTLNPVTVVDDVFGTITLGATSLAPGETTSGTATLTLTQSLLDIGSQTNVATATATPPTGPDLVRTRTKTVTFLTTPSINLEKSYAWTTGNGSSIGDVVTYTYLVTNTGNVTLNPVSLVDDLLGPITLPVTSLAPGASTTALASHTVDAADLLAGSRTNIATATGTPPTGPDVTYIDSKTVKFGGGPAIQLIKSFEWTTGNGSHAGDVVTYTFTVVNSGSVPLTGVSVVDSQLGGIPLGSTSLAAGASTTGTADLTLTQTMLDSGSIVNLATATGTPPVGPGVTDSTTRTITLVTTPSVLIVKTYAWTTGNGAHVGDVVTFTYTVTNNGNVTLNPVSVMDSQLGAITLNDTNLAPGEVATGTATLTLDQTLLDTGSQTNTAAVTATPPIGPDIHDTSTKTVKFIVTPAIRVIKEFEWTTGNGAHVGDVVTFTYTVTNVGNVTLDPVSLTDDKLGTITLGATSLAPGASTTGTATLTLNQALLDSGSQTNTATAHGTPPSGPEVTDQSTRTVAFLTTPAILIVKSFAWTTGNGAAVGDVVTYTYDVTNVGNVTLNSVKVTDDKLGPITLAATTLAPGASTTGTATLTLDQALLDSGSQTNIAAATGTPQTGPDAVDSSTKTVVFLTTPAILINKSFEWTTGDGSHVGDIVTYTYTVTNTGNVTLNPVSVQDDRLGAISLLASSLAPRATTTGTAQLTLTQPLLDAGSQTNIATATGKPLVGSNATATDSKIVDFIQISKLTLVKHVSIDGGATWFDANEPPGPITQQGSLVRFRYVITNTGNVDLFSLALTDDQAGSISLSSTTIAPGGVITAYRSAIAIVGQYTNIGTVLGTPLVGAVAGASDPSNYFGTPGGVTGLYQAYPAVSPQTCSTGYVTGGIGDRIIAAMPGIFCIDSGNAWANYIAAAQDGVNYGIKNVTFVKSTPAFAQCTQVFPAHKVTQHGSANIRHWWPLMYESPGTTFTLSILYGTSALYDDDGTGPNKPAWAHNTQWTWSLQADFESMSNLMAVFHQMPFGKSEVPLISDEALYDSLQAKIAAAQAAYEAGDTATAAAVLADFELEVMDACIDETPAFPNVTGPGTGIANTQENPACCKLLVDTEYVLQHTGIGMPGKHRYGQGLPTKRMQGR